MQHCSNCHISSNIYIILCTTTNLYHFKYDVDIYFRVYYRGPGLTATQSIDIQGEANRQIKVTGLRPSSTYQFVVAVINDVGMGKFSSFFKIETHQLRKSLKQN